MIDEPSNAGSATFPPEIGTLPLGHRDRQRAFERARHAATTLCQSLDRDEITPAMIERYRWLIVAMATARGTPGGLAIAELARRGFVLDILWAPRCSSRLCSIGASGVVWLARGLPSRWRLRWSTMEQRVLGIDIAALPRLEIVSAHETVRIKSALRREGHDIGWPQDVPRLWRRPGDQPGRRRWCRTAAGSSRGTGDVAMTEEITAHQLLPFLSKQAALPLWDASAMPGGLIVTLDDHDERVTWALVYYTDKRTEHCLSRGALEERGWAVDRSIKRDISPELAERIIKAHIEEIIQTLGRGLALRESVSRHHGIEDDWHCQLISREIDRLEAWRGSAPSGPT